MIEIINNAWNWKGFNAIELVKSNDFGNVIFKTDKNQYWRICPEELNCEKIANSIFELENLFQDNDYILDWEMQELLKIAIKELGELENDQKYCLKMPAAIGGLYDKTNLGKISFSELISFSGDIGFQIKDIKDGERIELKIIK
jgi:hypothetical protein